MTERELQWLQRNTMALEAIRDILHCIRLQLMADRPPPDYQYDLARFPNFNWNAIGATVVERDRYGAAAVAWGGHTYTQRAPQNKFADAIWFSRCTGKGEDGVNVYQRLVTFKRGLSKAEPLPERVSQHIATTSLPFN